MSSELAGTFSLFDALDEANGGPSAPKAVTLAPTVPRESLTVVHQIVEVGVVKGRGVVTKMRCGAEASSKDTDGPVGTAWQSMVTCEACVARTVVMRAARN